MHKWIEFDDKVVWRHKIILRCGQAVSKSGGSVSIFAMPSISKQIDRLSSRRSNTRTKFLDQVLCQF